MSSNHPALESLPTRCLLAVALSGEQLYVTGSEASDHVMIALSSADASKLSVNVNGDEQTFDRTNISSIVVIGGAGRDHLVIDASVDVPTTLMGNGGADLLVGGSGDDVLVGGSGRDRIDGGAGNDLIFAGSGRDLIAGGDGNDSIIGGSGDDAIDGGAGNDQIIGGIGDDYIDAGAGNDAVNGGVDYDSIMGGNGDDTLAGGKGDDDIDGGTGADSSTGGAGDDSFSYNDNSSDTIVDKTDGADRVYTKVGLDFIPDQFHNLFAATFPNSVPTGVRVNDDHTFVMLYEYNGDGTVYHAYFTFSGDHPFANEDLAHDGVELISYDVAPANLPAETRAAFENEHPDVTIKEVFADHDGDSKFAVIRYVNGKGESKVAKLDWMEGNEPV